MRRRLIKTNTGGAVKTLFRVSRPPGSKMKGLPGSFFFLNTSNGDKIIHPMLVPPEGN